MTPSDLHSVWARLFFRALATAGVTDVVVSPGSRSTPLALAAAAERSLTVASVIDERSAAFYALGQARMTGRPTVLVATSGSAGAHHFPAIVEASEAGIPLVTLTADRPWELQAAGASQTIDQRKLFGDHVRIALDLGLPEASALAAVPRIAARAVLEATGAHPGPVHVNAPFRKPLEPVAAGREPWSDEAERLLERGAPRAFAPRVCASAAGIDLVVAELSRAQRPILVAGPLETPVAEARPLARAIADLATRWRVPVFAEPTSGVRHGSSVACAAALETFLEARGFDPDLPDLVLQIGLVPISRGYQELCREAPRIVLARRGLPDPFASARAFVLGDPADTLARVAARAPISPPAARFADRTLARDAAVDQAAEAALSTWSEAAVARVVVHAVDEPGVLLVGNSLPPRDLDVFGGASSRDLTILHQRGAAGIDGLVAGAVGARSRSAHPVVLLLGDVSALHDAGSFALLAEVGAPLAVVVVDNRGGRIFEQLPLARNEALRPELDRLFVTERPRSALGLAAAFGVHAVTVEGVAALRAALRAALAAPRATVIECLVDASAGRARRAAVVADAARLVRSV